MANDIYAHTIVSLTDLKTWLGITVTTYDTVLTQILNSTTDFVERYLNRYVIARADLLTEYFDGQGGHDCFVDNPPILSLDSVYIEDIVTLDSTACADTDQVRFDSATGANAERGRIWLMNYAFGEGYADNCYRKYKGGWYAKDNGDGDGGANLTPMVPYDIWQAAREIAAACYYLKDRQKEDVQSISSAAGDSVTFFIGIMRPETAAKLDQYKRVKL